MLEVTINPEYWISVSEAAALRGVERQAMYYHLKCKRIESIVVGGKRLVRKSEIKSLKLRRKSKKRAEA